MLFRKMLGSHGGKYHHYRSDNERSNQLRNVGRFLRKYILQHLKRQPSLFCFHLHEFMNTNTYC